MDKGKRCFRNSSPCAQMESEQAQGSLATSQAADPMDHDASNVLQTWKATCPMPEGDLEDNYRHGVLGNSTTHIEDGCREFEEFVTSKFLNMSKSKKDALEHALAALEAVAGGKADG